jgi:WD40 repeat protein
VVAARSLREAGGVGSRLAKYPEAAMRFIDVSNDPVRAVAVSPGGRSLAVIAGDDVFAFDWDGRRQVAWHQRYVAQLAFSPDGEWLAAGGRVAALWRVGTSDSVTHAEPVTFTLAGGVGFAPDGKHLYASRLPTFDTGEQMDRWSVPGFKRAEGFAEWPPFPRLAFSPDGQFVGCVRHDRFELRFAVSGGISARLLMTGDPDSAFAAFSPDSTRAAVGWDGELHILDALAGKRVRTLVSPDAPFRDVSYTGSGRHLVTVDEAGGLKFWDAAAWRVERTYDWHAGPLTCVACTADGLAGACGTASGKVLLFDVDE